MSKLAPQRDLNDQIILGGRAIRLFGADSGVSVHSVQHQLREGYIPSFRIGTRRTTTPRLLQGMDTAAAKSA